MSMESKQAECSAETRAWMLTELQTLQGYCEPTVYGEDGSVEGDEPTCDFRVRLFDGDWYLNTGSSDYDQDHRGYWGCGSVASDDEPVTLAESLSDAIEEALDAQAESGEY